MPTRILTLSSLLCFTFLLFCCKKDSEAEKESPFFEFFKESSIIIDTVEQAVDSWEYGFTFTPLKDGKITQLGIKLPATGNFTATLWDLSGPTPAPLRSKTVQSATPHQNAFIDIPEIAVQKGVQYGLTVLADAFYRLTKSDNSQFIFPKTVGNISIESFNESINNSSLGTFPPTPNTTRVAPCVNVIFIAD